MKRVTLHEEIVNILKELPNKQESFQHIASEVNRHGIYQKRNGSAVKPNQIRARCVKYTRLFELMGR